ncbi:hypothetical protein GALL_429110 [mine drainage metagenome]|uniref:Uncharacterized protein n=1 Tax=mine drainage metagenome TaxID=410659 RepID=A0A1J5Q696_9ZZZZ
MGHAPVGVAPDLGAGRLVVRTRVVGVGELVEHAAAAFALQLLGEVARVLHAAGTRRQHQFGAVGLHRLRALDRQILGHDQQHAVAEHRRGHRQRDAGVARGGLDQRVSGADFAALLRAADHRQRRAVLDRTGRVVAFELGQQHVAAARRVGAGDARELHQRRVADGLVQGGISHEVGRVKSGGASVAGAAVVAGQV